MFGNNGRKLEVPIGNAKIGAKSALDNFGPDYYRINVQGLSKNLVIAKSGEFYQNEELIKLLFMPQTKTIVEKGKQERIEWYKTKKSKK
jgi:hypothetical protein